MTIHYTGRITYANGVAAEGGQVRVFDRDQPGKGDDDLTVTPGLSDALGIFTVEFDANRAQDKRMVTRTVPINPPYDWTMISRTFLEPDLEDEFQPYLRFSFTQPGQVLIGTGNLKADNADYQLSIPLEKPFLPSEHGFKFQNNFSGYALPFDLPALPWLTSPSTNYGLCGGMSAAALDWWLINRAVPTAARPPANGKPLQRYLFKRQVDSLGKAGKVILQFFEWMGLPEGGQNGLQRRSMIEFEKIRTRLNRFTPVPIGLVYVRWPEGHQIWLNHQVLALSYVRPEPEHILINIYDPNYPRRDDVFIQAERVPVGDDRYGLKLEQRIGSGTKKLHGFFAMPYQTVIPPAELTG